MPVKAPVNPPQILTSWSRPYRPFPETGFLCEFPTVCSYGSDIDQAEYPVHIASYKRLSYVLSNVLYRTYLIVANCCLPMQTRALIAWVLKPVLHGVWSDFPEFPLLYRGTLMVSRLFQDGCARLNKYSILTYSLELHTLTHYYTLYSVYVDAHYVRICVFMCPCVCYSEPFIYRGNTVIMPISIVTFN